MAAWSHATPTPRPRVPDSQALTECSSSEVGRLETPHPGWRFRRHKLVPKSAILRNDAAVGCHASHPFPELDPRNARNKMNVPAKNQLTFI